jgi:hypothetical protein
MASRNIGGIYAGLYLKDENFKKGIKGATSSLKDFAKGAGMVAAGNLAASAIQKITSASIDLGKYMVGSARKTLAQTAVLDDLSASVGIALGDMMLLQRAYEDGGRAAEMSGKDIGKMQKFIVDAAGKDAADDPFATIGLSARELLALGPAEQFRKIAASISAMGNPAERSAKALEIFGRAGLGLIPVFANMEKSVRVMGRMPELAEKYGKAMAEADEYISRLPLKSDQFFMGFTAGVIGELLPALKQVDNYDFTTLGERLGLSIATAFETLTDGTLWEIFKNKGDIAILKVAGTLQNMFKQGLYAAWENSPLGMASALANGKELLRSPKQAYDYAMGAANPFQASIDALQSASDVAWNLASKKRDQKLAAVASKTASPSKPFDITIPAPEKARRSWESSSYDVNAYQKRGLGLSGMSNATDKENKKIEILQTIRDILKKAQTDGELRWAT